MAGISPPGSFSFDLPSFEPPSVRQLGPQLDLGVPRSFNPAPEFSVPLSPVPAGMAGGLLAPLDFGPAELLIDVRPLTGPRFALGIPSLMDPGEVPVHQPFLQRVMKDGVLPTLDGVLASVDGSTKSLISKAALNHELAEIRADNPNLTEVGSLKARGYADYLFAKNVLTRAGANTIGGFANLLRVVTNPEIRSQFGQSALSAPVLVANHPVNIASGLASNYWNTITGPEPLADKVADLIPSPSSWLKGTSVLLGGSGGIVGSSFKWDGPSPKPGIHGFHIDSPPDVVAEVRDTLMKYRRDNYLGGKYLFDPDNPAFAFSAEPKIHHFHIREALRANPNRATAGFIHPDPDNLGYVVHADMLSLAYGDNWTPRRQELFAKLMESKGIRIYLADAWPGPRWK